MISFEVFSYSILSYIILNTVCFFLFAITVMVDIARLKLWNNFSISENRKAEIISWGVCPPEVLVATTDTPLFFLALPLNFGRTFLLV